jgi:hypothetical protein
VDGQPVRLFLTRMYSLRLTIEKAYGNVDASPGRTWATSAHL